MRILIATSRFEDYAGSEITAFEYAEEFKLQGHDVTISSFTYADTYQLLCDDHAIELSVFDNKDLIEKYWDIIWIFHTPTFYTLFSKYNYKSKHIVFSSLSHFEPLESPPLEARNIDLFTVNSAENLSFFKGCYPAYASRTKILPNSIPRNFFQKATTLSEERKLIIVSNHMPDEVFSLSARLRESGWQVDIFGVGYNHKKITSDDLIGYSACVTIGKTVQYCLGLEIPVLCYDHFGGPGWITQENVFQAASYNFSGRCTVNKLTDNDLFSLFSKEIFPSKHECQQLAIIAKSEFSLQNNLSRILGEIMSNPIRDDKKELTTDNILVKGVQVYLRELAIQYEYKQAWHAETNKRKSVERQLLSKHQKLMILEKEYKTKSDLFEIIERLNTELTRYKNIEQYIFQEYTLSLDNFLKNKSNLHFVLLQFKKYRKIVMQARSSYLFVVAKRLKDNIKCSKKDRK